MICPEFFGCSGKLDFSETRTLANAALNNARGDYSSLLDGKLILSIDRVGRCSKYWQVFAEMALSHVCRDIEAGFGNALQALVCYEFGEDAEEHDRLELTKFLGGAIRERGIEVGKCHSVLVEGVTSLVISVVGLRAGFPQKVAEEGLVWLNRPFGAAKLQYMAEIGTLGRPNEHAVAITAPADVVQFSWVFSVASDVSGHGLAGCLLELSDRLSIEIDISLSPQNAAASEVLNCPITLLENEPGSYGALNLRIDDGARTLALLKETAGPIIALSAEIDRGDRLPLEQAGWISIGRYSHGPNGVAIRWTA